MYLRHRGAGTTCESQSQSQSRQPTFNQSHLPPERVNPAQLPKVNVPTTSSGGGGDARMPNRTVGCCCCRRQGPLRNATQTILECRGCQSRRHKPTADAGGGRPDTHTQTHTHSLSRGLPPLKPSSQHPLHSFHPGHCRRAKRLLRRAPAQISLTSLAVGCSLCAAVGETECHPAAADPLPARRTGIRLDTRPSGPAPRHAPFTATHLTSPSVQQARLHASAMSTFAGSLRLLRHPAFCLLAPSRYQAAHSTRPLESRGKLIRAHQGFGIGRQIPTDTSLGDTRNRAVVIVPDTSCQFHVTSCMHNSPSSQIVNLRCDPHVASRAALPQLFRVPFQYSCALDSYRPPPVSWSKRLEMV